MQIFWFLLDFSHYLAVELFYGLQTYVAYPWLAN